MGWFKVGEVWWEVFRELVGLGNGRKVELICLGFGIVGELVVMVVWWLILGLFELGVVNDLLLVEVLVNCVGIVLVG